MENPETQDIDSDSQENYQEEPIVSLQHWNDGDKLLKTGTMTLGRP